MNKEEDTAYDNYMAALDKCIAIAKRRAFMRIEDAPADMLLTLDRQYLSAMLDVERRRFAWVKLRDARFADTD